MSDSDREVWCLKAELGAPVAHAEPYIHLDGFLSFAVSRELGYTADDFEDAGPPEHFEDDVPLRRYEHDGEWVWAATAAGIASLDGDNRDFNAREWDHNAASRWFDDADPSDAEHWTTTRWRRRFDHDARHQAREIHIDTQSGPFKSYNAALPYAGTDRLTFFFEPKPGTDPERVVALLEAHVMGVGKKRSQGYGNVREWTCVEATGSVESALYHGGRVLRSLPASWLTEVVPGVRYERRTVRPPYWHPDNQPSNGMSVPPYVELPRESLTEDIEPTEPLHEVVR